MLQKCQTCGAEFGGNGFSKCPNGCIRKAGPGTWLFKSG